MHLGGWIMLSIVKKVFCLILVAGCLAMFGATAVWADDDVRYYLRIGGVNQKSVDGDFDGARSYYFEENNNIKAASPKIDPANGYELAFGGQNGRLIGELSYSASEHDSEILNPYWASIFTVGKTISQKVSFDIKYLFLDPETAKIIPYGRFGVSYNAFTTENGAADLDINSDDNEVTAINGHGDSTFRGYGYDLGLGLLCRLSDKLALEGSYVYSRIILNRLEARGYTGLPEDDMESNTREIRLGLNYYF
jgi:opacity protein-like surface antigen